jgi:hypothetical protein
MFYNISMDTEIRNALCEKIVDVLIELEEAGKPPFSFFNPVGFSYEVDSDNEGDHVVVHGFLNNHLEGLKWSKANHACADISVTLDGRGDDCWWEEGEEGYKRVLTKLQRRLMRIKSPDLSENGCIAVKCPPEVMDSLPKPLTVILHNECKQKKPKQPQYQIQPNSKLTGLAIAAFKLAQEHPLAKIEFNDIKDCSEAKQIFHALNDPPDPQIPPVMARPFGYIAYVLSYLRDFEIINISVEPYVAPMAIPGFECYVKAVSSFGEFITLRVERVYDVLNGNLKDMEILELKTYPAHHKEAFWTPALVRTYKISDTEVILRKIPKAMTYVRSCANRRQRSWLVENHRRSKYDA